MTCSKITICAIIVICSFSQACFAAKPPPWHTGYAYDPRCSTYVHSYGHPEAPQRVTWIDKRLHDEGLIPQLTEIRPIKDPMPHILRVHDSAHVAGIHSIGQNDSAAEKIGPIADLAAALALGAVRDVCNGKVKNAFCNIRPPGHHVTNSGSTSGFCAYATVVIAARYAQEVENHQRVLVCDWDYHHGNGTVHFLCNDTNAMFFEVSYDGGGSNCNDEVSHIITVGSGQSYTNDQYVGLWENYVVLAADLFKPDIVLISCGFDIKQNDALGSYNVTARGISRLTKIAMDIAEKHCGGKLVSMLEGGYYDSESGFGNVPQRTWYGISQCAENHIRTLMTSTIQAETPYFDSLQTPILFYYAARYAARPGVQAIPRLFLRETAVLLPEQPGKVFDMRGRFMLPAPAAYFRHPNGIYLKKQNDAMH
jgi:acetoin utilization deacetylase AcuC-like enzyme